MFVCARACVRAGLGLCDLKGCEGAGHDRHSLTTEENPVDTEVGCYSSPDAGSPGCVWRVFINVSTKSTSQDRQLCPFARTHQHARFQALAAVNFTSPSFCHSGNTTHTHVPNNTASHNTIKQPSVLLFPAVRAAFPAHLPN